MHKMYSNIQNFEDAHSLLNQASHLLKQDTIDSITRYFQLGIKNNSVHVPSLFLEDEYIIHKRLAEKFLPIVRRLGFEFDHDKLTREGRLELLFKKGDFTINFAAINPVNRTLDFHFDIEEMEREREVHFDNLQRKIASTQEKYFDNKEYAKQFNNIQKVKYRKIVKRIQETLSSISDEISALEIEMQEIQNNRTLFEDIKNALPAIQYQFRTYGYVVEFFKGEEYEV